MTSLYNYTIYNVVSIIIIYVEATFTSLWPFLGAPILVFVCDINSCCLPLAKLVLLSLRLKCWMEQAINLANKYFNNQPFERDRPKPIPAQTV